MNILHRINRLSPAVVVLFVAVSPLGAGEKETPKEELIRLSLDECITSALNNSRSLLAKRHRLEALDAQLKQAYWAPFSNISASFSATVVPDKCVEETRYGIYIPCGSDTVTEDGQPGKDGIIDNQLDPSAMVDDVRSFESDDWGPSLKVSIRAGIPIYTFGKATYGIRALKAARAAKQAEFPRFKHKVRFQVEQAYHAIAGAREMVYTIGKGRKHLIKAREKVENDLENQEGTSTEIDLIKLKIYENEVDQYEIQAVQLEKIGLAALRFLVGGKNRHKVDILDAPQDRIAADIGSLDESKDNAINNRPELRALKHAVNALEAKVKLRRAQFFPDLLGVVGFRHSWTGGRTDLDNWTLVDNYNYGPSVGFALVLDYKLDLGLDIYRIREAKAELAALMLDQEEALEGVMLEVEKVYHSVNATKETLEGLSKSRRLVKGWLAAEVQNHETGLSSAKDVKDALVEYFKVMASIHKLTHDYNVGIAELGRVTGIVGSGK